LKPMARAIASLNANRRSDNGFWNAGDSVG